MKRSIRWLSLVVVAVAAGWVVGRGSTPASAQVTSSVPRSYGSVKASTEMGLVFEAADGTVRLVNWNNGNVIKLINRTE